MFDALIRQSLRHRGLVLVLAGLLLVLGAPVMRQMPVDVLPDLDRPTVTILTEAGGLAPPEVERLISQPVEATLAGMPGLLRLRSVSGIGLSVVTVEFDFGTDLWRNRQQITERLALLGDQLPPGAKPHLGPVASLMGEILLIALPVEPGAEMTVREHADWVLRPQLLTVPGVAQVIPIGGAVRQWRIEPDLARLAELGLPLQALAEALQGIGMPASAGFLERAGQEWLLRQSTIADPALLAELAVGMHEGQPLRLGQVARVVEAPAPTRGDAGFAAGPAVILAVQKQPGTDTLALSAEIESLLGGLSLRRPAGMGAPVVLFRQADFIEQAVGNVAEALRDGAIIVAILLYLFLVNFRTTAISLTAIPLSLVAAALVFAAFDLGINTMTLGGLAIAIGELVDDAVVDVENVLRRLRQNALAALPRPVLGVIAEASVEVRSGVVYATLIVVLAFVPLFALPGLEGRLFVPLGVAYVIAILASLLVAVTVTPVLCALLLPRMPQLTDGDSRLVRLLKRGQRRWLDRAFAHDGRIIGLAAALVGLVLASSVALPRAFLPAFNEPTLTITLELMPGTALSESARVGRLAETLVQSVPGVLHVGRRTGRAELDEHANGAWISELEVAIAPDADRSRLRADLRAVLAQLPLAISIGAPIGHRIDHMLSGVRAPIVVKLYGEDLDRLRALALGLQAELSGIPGIADLALERQVRVPQLHLEPDTLALAEVGLSPSDLQRDLQRLLDGEAVAERLDGERRQVVLLRLAEAERDPAQLLSLPITTPAGAVPLSRLVRVVESNGPNQIVREQGRRRIVLAAGAEAGQLPAVADAVAAAVAAYPLPPGYRAVLEGQHLAGQAARQQMLFLGLLSLSLIYLVLRQRYRSSVLALIVMASIPLALTGSVLALWLAGAPLSLPALVGAVTLAGIATRNSILKLSHYLNLCSREGLALDLAMVRRGSEERLTPVLMTAGVTALALTPLLLSAEAPGKEMLYPVAVVIFGGLISATLLDTLLTPLLFWRYGRHAAERLLAAGRGDETW